jgi:ATP-dependent Clp protease adapter protein ClpS
MNRYPDRSQGPSDSFPIARRPALSCRAGCPPIAQYRVILHGTPEQQLMVTLQAIMELTRFCRAEATHKMWSAHHWGRCQLFVTFRERAELCVELFAERGLVVSIEPI